MAQMNYLLEEQSKTIEDSAKDVIKRAKAVWSNSGNVLNLSGAGYSQAFSWQAVPGTNKIEINSGQCRISPAAVETLTSFSFNKHNNIVDINIGEAKAIRSFKLYGLTGGASNASLHSSNNINDHGLKLLVSVAGANGAFTPIYSVPEVPAKGVFPGSYVGASFKNDTLSFNTPLQTSTIRLLLVDKNFPEATTRQNISISSLQGTYMSLPHQLSVDLDKGSENETSLFSFTGSMSLQMPAIKVSFAQQLFNTFQQKLDAQQEDNLTPIESVLNLSSTSSDGNNDAFAAVLINPPEGYLLREISGIHITVLEGETKNLNIDTEQTLAAEQAASVIGDIKIQYNGIKILPDLSSNIPVPTGNIQGQVVSHNAIIKKLPPLALENQSIARIGIIGRAPEDCELALELLDMSGGIEGSVLPGPIVLKLSGEKKIQAHWFKIDKQAPFNLPLGIRLRCNSGRFYWAASPESLIRLAIYDIDPGNEIIKLNDQNIANGSQLPLVDQKHTFPPEQFRHSLPKIHSNLFLTVEIADLTLRYAR